MRGFLFGAATSAHQVEGNNVHNDWWAWEKANPKVESSGKAADHYNRFKEDFALAKSLGHNAHRLSLEWSRIQPFDPAQGKPAYSERAVEHYREVLQELRRLGLKSFVTLHHFTNPQWFAEGGGWTRRDSPTLFAEYAEMVARELGDLIDFWVTINEPMVYATQSFARGVWPPEVKSIKQTLRVVKHLAEGHNAAYRVIHKRLPDAQVGFAKHLVAYLPEHRRQLDDQVFTRVEDSWFNHRWLARTRGAYDFIGANYYFTRKHQVTVFPPRVRKLRLEGGRTDMDWPIHPQGLTHVLLHMRRYKKPIYITENGLADRDDRLRADFIRDHLRAVEAAQAQGADVRGYLHWSLLDNFEWAEGFEPRFGLVEVDYETMERRPRPSAYVYKAIIEQSRG